MAAKDIDLDLTDVELAKKEIEAASEAIAEGETALEEVTSDNPNVQQELVEAQNVAREAAQDANNMQEQFNNFINNAKDKIKNIAASFSDFFAGKHVENDISETSQTEVKSSEERMADVKDRLQQAHEKFQEQKDIINKGKGAAVSIIEDKSSITLDEYQSLVNEVLDLYFSKEQDLAGKFNSNIKIQLEKLYLETAPRIINSVIDSVYLRQTQRKLQSIEEISETDVISLNDFTYGTKEYNKGLIDYKNHIAENVSHSTKEFDLNKYYSSEQLENKSDYEKSLLVLTNRDDSAFILGNAILEYFEIIDEKSTYELNVELKTVFKNIDIIKNLFSVEYETAEDVESSYYTWRNNKEETSIGYHYLNDFMDVLLPPYYSFFEDKNKLDAEKYEKITNFSQRFSDITEEEINKLKEDYEESGSLDDEVYETMAKLNKIDLLDLVEDYYYVREFQTLDLILPYTRVNLEVNGDIYYVNMNDIANMYENEDTNYSTNLIIKLVEDSKLTNTNLEDDAVFLNISGINIQTYLSSIKKSIDDTGKFDYLRMLATSHIGEDDKEKNIIINQNGLDFETNVQEIKDYYDVYGYEELYLIKHLYDNNRIDDSNYNINIAGRPINCSLKELSIYFDEENKFDLEKFVDEFELSESEYMYLYNYKLNNPVNLEDLKITAINEKTRDFYEKYGSVDQGGLNKLFETNTDESKEEWNRLLDFCKDKYHLAGDTALSIMRSLDSVGACSYADMCNIIYEMYDFDNEKFMHDFSYPIVNENGTLNSNQLLLDLYIYQNIGDANNPGRLLIKDTEGNLHVNENYLDEYNENLDVHNQEYMSGYGYFKLDKMKSFLRDNNCSIEDYHNYQYKIIYFYDEKYKEEMNKALNSDSIVSLSFGDTAEYYFLGDNPYYYHMNNDGHAVTGVGITEDGIIERTWGEVGWTPFDSIGYGNAVIIYKKGE